jgi:hypothetical protein
MAEKVFLKCSAKEKTFASGGSILNLGFKVSDLVEFAQLHANDRGYLNLCVQSRREVGKFGDTHAVTLDTWVAKPKEAAAAAAVDTSDIPF